MQSRCDILNLEWSTNSRDSNIVEPVLCYLEMYEHLKIIRTNYENMLWKLNYYAPKMLVISNYIGAPENTMLARQAHTMGIKVVSMISEGDVKNAATAPNFFWGWNKEKKNYLDLLLVWTERSKRLFVENIPEAAEFNIQVSGATGFDRYQLLHYMQKPDFLTKYRQNYQRVVCLASWGFDSPSLRGKALTGNQVYTKETREYLVNSCARIREGYGELIKRHPDTLFVLKLHPGCININQTEFAGLSQYTNTLLLQTEENIADVINASDFLIAFESTTALEAWLLGKESLFFNPTGGKFIRSEIIEGSPEIISNEELENAYEAFYREGRLPGFAALTERRTQLIESIIQYGDGKNHQRAAREIMKIWKMPEQTACFTRNEKHERIRELLYETRYLVQRHTPLVRLHKAQMHEAAIEKYNFEERKQETKKYKAALEKLYQKE